MSFDDRKKSGFSGFLNKIIFSDTEENQNPPEQKPDKKIKSSATINMPVDIPKASSSENREPGGKIDKELVDKIHSFIQSINAPGVDFLELWNVADAMEGGVNQQNLKNAYTTLKIVSNNSLSLNHIESSGQNYIREIESLLSKDIAKKEEDKNRLLQEITLKKGELEDKIKSYTSQINSLKMQLEAAEKNLQQLNGKYDPKISEIDQKIAAGKRAGNLVVNEINSIMTMVRNSIKD